MYLYIFTMRENELDGLYLIDLWKQLIVIIKISENTFLNEMQRTDYYYLNWNMLDVITEIEIISEI